MVNHNSSIREQERVTSGETWLMSEWLPGLRAGNGRSGQQCDCSERECSQKLHRSPQYESGKKGVRIKLEGYGWSGRRSRIKIETL